MLAANRMGTSDSLAFLRNVEKELGYEDQKSVDFREAVEAQYNSLDQPGRRTLISHLTHNNGALNEDTIACLPFMRERSVKMIENPVRKERSDKIDLGFISEFMHDYCRYLSLYCTKQLNCHYHLQYILFIAELILLERK